MKKIVGAVMVVAALTACGRTQPPTSWCEFDDTDQRVPDSYCFNNTPGYEWEPDGDDYGYSHKKTTTKRSPSPTPAPKTAVKR